MELQQRTTNSPVHDGYQHSPSLFGPASPTPASTDDDQSLKSPTANTSFIPATVSTGRMNGAGTVAEADGSTERLKLLQLKTPSYSTTGVDQRRSAPMDDGAGGLKQPQESLEPMDSSFTAILPLDGDENGSNGDSFRPDQTPRGPGRRGSIGPFPVTSASPTVQIWGYKRDTCLFLVTALLCVLTGGLLVLLLYWKPKWLAAMTALPCKLSEATLILIKDDHQQWSLEKVQMLYRVDGITFLDTSGAPSTTPTFRVFDHRKIRFIWHPKRSQFQLLADLDQRCPLSVYYQRQELGLTRQMMLARAACYGPNEMRVELTPILQLFFREALQPLSVFQVFSVILWFTQNYILFAFVIILMTSISWAVNVYSTRKSQKDLRRMVGLSGHASILRDGIVQNLPSAELVPGDVVVLDPEADCGRNVDYDAVIISGGCVMNESSLTGESVPVTKTSLFYTEGAPKEIFDYPTHGKHVIYSGTKLLQVRSSAAHPAKAVVIKTGFQTSKGRLVRSILFPKPIDYRFTKDLFIFLCSLGIIGVIGMIYSVIMLQRFHTSKYVAIERVLDVITIVIPPLLPAAMSVGVVLAQSRLRRKKIFCISPSTINACGSIDAVCFDKTGTLTEDGLELTHARTTTRGRFDDERSAREISAFSLHGQPSERHAARLMAACHTLVLLDHTEPGDGHSDSRIGGDPIDTALFENTGWRLKKPGGLTIVQHPGCVGVVEGPSASSDDKDREKLLIVQQFIFTSNLKRMSVIVRDQISGAYSAYCKGAPETIKGICLPETVPLDFDTVLAEYTKEGCRVIAMAVKRLSGSRKDSVGGDTSSEFDPKQWSRDRVESEMAFVGFCILENRLKPATTPIIYELNSANIRPVMVTGDHVDTAIHVARQCGIAPLGKKLYLVEFDQHGKHPILKHVPPPAHMEAPLVQSSSVLDADSEDGASLSYQLAITGPVFAQVYSELPDLLPRLTAVCSVYARMAPEQKTQVVNLLQSIDYTVAACGDGANDCGALKAAHAGVSLSEAEASVASPFTSQFTDISCVPTLISEGRAALVTSFGLAKYMVAYSFIQFFTVCLLYSANTDVANNQFVFIDLFLVTLLSAVFGRTPAEERLHPKQPPSKLVSPPIILGMFLHAFVTILFQGMAFGVVAQQPWFNSTVTGIDTFSSAKSMQGTATFLASIFQYIWMAFVLSKGFPYRKPFYYNWLMVLLGLAQIAVCMWFALDTSRVVANLMYLVPAPEPFYRFCAVVLAFVNLMVYVFVEKVVIDWFCLTRLREKKPAGLAATWLSGRPRHSPMHVRIVRLIGDSPNWLTAAQTKI